MTVSTETVRMAKSRPRKNQSERSDLPCHIIMSCIESVGQSLKAFNNRLATFRGKMKARLHRRFLSRQLDIIFVALKLHQVANMFKTPAISRQQIAPGLHVRF